MRYGGPIAADLRQYYGVRLYDLWRDELTVGETLELIEQLPHWSRFVAAMVDDDDLLNEVGDEQLKPTPPPLTAWTPEVNQLARIEDRLGDVLKAVVGGYAKKLPKVRPVQRPETAADRARVRRKHEGHDRVVAMVQAARERANQQSTTTD